MNYDRERFEKMVRLRAAADELADLADATTRKARDAKHTAAARLTAAIDATDELIRRILADDQT